MRTFNFFEEKKQFAEPTNENLKSEVLEFIKQQVKFGFENQAKILETISDVFYGESELNEDWLKQVISEHYDHYQTESKKWTKPTDFDTLAKVFDELNQEKIIALHNAGYTRQDGYSDVGEVFYLLKAKNIVPFGYCFYHTQDLERAVDPANKYLFLAFGDINQNKINQNNEQGILTGQKIVSKLKENGFAVEWNGTLEQRIKIKNITWQKIPDGQSWGIARAIEYLHKSK